MLDRYELAHAAEQRFESLSGGQQARFQILLLELSGATLLLLDEPTDNLDVESAEALEDGLEAFEGTVLAVTHDRWFARGLRPLPGLRRRRLGLRVRRAGLGRAARRAGSLSAVRLLPAAGRTPARSLGDRRPDRRPVLFLPGCPDSRWAPGRRPTRPGGPSSWRDRGTARPVGIVGGSLTAPRIASRRTAGGYGGARTALPQRPRSRAPGPLRPVRPRSGRSRVDSSAEQRGAGRVVARTVDRRGSQCRRVAAGLAVTRARRPTTVGRSPRDAQPSSSPCTQDVVACARSATCVLAPRRLVDLAATSSPALPGHGPPIGGRTPRSGAALHRRGAGPCRCRRPGGRGPSAASQLVHDHLPPKTVSAAGPRPGPGRSASQPRSARRRRRTPRSCRRRGRPRRDRRPRRVPSISGGQGRSSGRHQLRRASTPVSDPRQTA